VNWVGRHKLLSAVIAVTVVWFFGAVSGSADDQPPADDPQSEFASGEDSSSSSDDEDQDRASEPTNSSKPKRKTFRVVNVVDGDTVDLGNGETVRLAGIDAPEVGECGYKRARNTLEGLVLGERVSLGKSDEDHDRYGRLLRYIDVGDTDAGLRLIKDGLAVARYDSRDGYGFHPREPRYIKADRASPAYACAPKPVPLVTQPKQEKNCAPGYSPCIRPYPPDLDCPDIGRPVQVTGSDPHGLDRDGDGVACEWG
jgi:endonuclease YncB( thermonuclease family)